MKRLQGVASTGLAIGLGIASLTLAYPGGVYAMDEAAVAEKTKFEYVVKDGDTLASIAMKLSGSENDWILIAQENDMANATGSQPLEAGMRLKIPEKMLQS